MKMSKTFNFGIFTVLLFAMSLMFLLVSSNAQVYMTSILETNTELSESQVAAYTELNTTKSGAIAASLVCAVFGVTLISINIAQRLSLLTQQSRERE